MVRTLGGMLRWMRKQRRYLRAEASTCSTCAGAGRHAEFVMAGDEVVGVRRKMVGCHGCGGTGLRWESVETDADGGDATVPGAVDD